jgi:uncharacterized surface protein with fasciclin (FAS1) repeats
MRRNLNNRLLAAFLLPAILAVMAGGTSCTKKLVNNPIADSIYLGSLPFVINNNATFDQFYIALQTTGWLDTLYGKGPYTVLLPNDDAYLGYSEQSSNGTLGNFSYYEGAEVRNGLTLSNSVGYDIIKGSISLRSLPLGINQPLPSITGRTHYVTRYLSPTGDTVTAVDGQIVISLDNPATNGLIQVVAGAVPYPDVFPTVLEQIQSDTNLTFFAAALQRTHLDTLLEGPNPYTVLAPLNGSFTNLPYWYPNGIPGLHLVSLDSVLAADPIKLSQFIKYYILPGRYYLNDFMRPLQSLTDTLPLTMLNGEVVKFTMSTYYYGTLPFMAEAPGAGTLQPVFFGTGNLANGAMPADPDNEVPNTIQLYFENNSDLTAQNGVVQTIQGLLIP